MNTLLDVDHIIPLWVPGGPGDVDGNIQFLCREPCHREKTAFEATVRARAKREGVLK